MSPVTYADLLRDYHSPYSLYDELSQAGDLFFDSSVDAYLVTSAKTIETLLKQSQIFTAEPPRGPHESGALGKLQDIIWSQMLFYSGQKQKKAHHIIEEALKTIHKDPQTRVAIRGCVERILDRALARGRIDLINEVALLISANTSAFVLGLDACGDAELTALTLRSNAFGDTTSGHWGEGTAYKDIFSMHAHMLRAVRERSRPAGGRLTLLDALIDGKEAFHYQGMDGDEVVATNALMLFSAGRITAERAIAEGMIHLLLEHPLEWEELCATRLRGSTPHGSRMARLATQELVEEVVRFVTPSRHIARWAVRDIHLSEFGLGDRVIKKGQQCILFLEAGNYDPDVFPCPHDFDPGRRPNPHCAFGFGDHWCPGAPLARIELIEVFQALAGRQVMLSHLEGAVAVYRESPNLGGWKTFPVHIAAKG